MLIDREYYRVGINDNKFWHKNRLVMYLYKCMLGNQSAWLDVTPEGSNLHGCGLYQQLDEFCDATGYAKQQITIRTGNMIEHHHSYKIQHDPTAWFEVPIMQDWIRKNPQQITTAPEKHFGHFIGKSNWHRLWLAAVLDSDHANKTFQTYNTGLATHYLAKTDDVKDFIGLEDLVKNDCDILDRAVSFLKTCPRVIPEDLRAIQHMPTYIKQQDHYPIQFPANLNILQYYNDIFVDVVHETFVRDNVCFATEKTWRPMLARRPFISMAGRQHLEFLHRLGFQTFSQYWNETYDDHGMQHRIHKIIDVINHIATWDTKQLEQVLLDMRPILDHNYNVFMNLTGHKILKAFCE